MSTRSEKDRKRVWPCGSWSRRWDGRSGTADDLDFGADPTFFEDERLNVLGHAHAAITERGLRDDVADMDADAGGGQAHPERHLVSLVNGTFRGFQVIGRGSEIGTGLQIPVATVAV